MNAGFSNLDFLKKQLLAKSFSSDKRFDDLILALGLGIANQVEKFCGRKFARLVNAQETFAADRASFLLSRFPVEPPISLVEYKQDEPTGWATQNQTAQSNDRVIQSLDAESGLIYFRDDQDCGDYWSQMRFTFTGGFFWEQLEPDDANYPSPVPATATPLPDSLRLAWLLQCKHVWAFNDKVGTDLLKSGDQKSVRFPEDWALGVETILADFVRPNFT